MRENGVFCVNVLGSRHEGLSGVFAAAPGERRFDTGHWPVLVSGAPALDDAAAVVDCRIVRIAEIGSHTVFFGEVLAMQLHSDVDGLLWFDRRYHPLGGASAS